MYEALRVRDATLAAERTARPQQRAQVAGEHARAPASLHRLAEIEIAPAEGVVQRVKSKAELEKAFAALGEDAEVATLPSPEYGDALNERILKATTPEERQAALNAVGHAYGIGGPGDAIVYDPDVEEEGETEPDRAPRVGPHIFAQSKTRLGHLRMALTLNHENLHRRQYERIGETHLAYGPAAMSSEVRDAIVLAATKEAKLREILAYESELSTIASYRATFFSTEPVPDEIERELARFENDALEERENYLREAAFTEEQQALLDAGDFAALLLNIRKDVPAGTTRYSLSEADWSEFIDATAILEQMKVLGPKLQARPTSSLRRRWQQLDRSLEQRFYRAKLAHWWLVRSPGDMATLDVRAEVEKILREAELSRPPDFWGRVAASPWAPKPEGEEPQL
ncbi:MAG TPA: hypothetical protein VMA36_11060 [Candidatus Limnocylindria bacterium]|nr:hypothetical protein [Candidatus Limnocylindria bacterium]